MAIPGAGEMMPGMNTQARKPAFEPKGDMMAIPAQPAPAKPPQSIREYLQTLQAGQVPTFTNIPGQTGTFSEEQGALAFQDIGPGAGGPVVPFPEQQGAIPEKPAEKKIEGKDPYEKAKNALPTILPDLKEQFDMKYGNTTSLEEYDQLWAQAVNHANNQLIKSFEKEDNEKEKQALKWFKDYTAGSIQDWKRTGDLGALREKVNVQKIAQDAQTEWDKWTTDAAGDNEFDPKVIGARAMLERYPDVNTYVNAKIDVVTKAIEGQVQRQTERDRSRRGGGTPQAAAQGKQITPEQQGLIQQAKALNDQLKTMTSPITGQPLTPAERLDIIRGKKEFQPILELL
jgi:hypothetical protein